MLGKKGRTLPGGVRIQILEGASLESHVMVCRITQLLFTEGTKVCHFGSGL